MSETLIVEFRLGKCSLIDCHWIRMASFFPSIKPPQRFTCLFSIQRNKHQDFASDGMKSECAELIYQLSAVQISQIFAPITLCYQQAFLGVCKLSLLVPKGQSTDSNCSSASDAAIPFCILLQPRDFLQTLNFSCAAVVLHLGLTSVTLTDISVSEALFPLLRVEKQVVFSTDSLWFLIHKKFFFPHI